MQSTLLVVALAALVAGHNDGAPALPRIVGGSKFIADLKSRNIFSEAVGFRPSMLEAREPSHVEERQTVTTCGPGVGSCQKGYCCSAAGYCGTGTQYCAAPDCQFNYGPACDANIVPSGTTTKNIARTHVGSIPYGGDNTAGVQDCIVTGEMALTFDDGPYLYTKDLLDLLDRYNAKATFFITGNNIGKGQIDDCATGYPQLIQRMYASGHQVASHTWSHQNLSALSATDFDNQIYYNEMALRNILGVIPTYLRPPFSECGSACSKKLSTMGYHSTYFDLDTSDYLNDDVNLIQNSKNIFTEAIKDYGSDPSQSNFLVIGHDIHYQTVYNLTEFMLKTMASSGYGTSVTVGQCLGDPKANWYRAAGSASVACSNSAGSSSSSAAATSATAVKSSTTVAALSTTAATAGTTTTPAKASTTATTPAKASTTAITSAKASTTATTSAKASATAALKVSTDATCGGTSGYTCQGSSWGNCCSQYGWCGSTTNYCGTACQKGFGTCN